MSNKGKKRVYCKECGRFRFPQRARSGDMYHYVCSQGHQWTDIVGTLEQINEIVLKHLVPGLADMMFANSPLLKHLR